jgi:hypothetical protein
LLFLVSCYIDVKHKRTSGDAMENVIPFPHPVPPIQPIAHFIRLGESGYLKLANLHAVGRFPTSRVVVDASRLKHQKEFVASLRARGVEIVLDTKVAELSAREKFSGHAHHAPWAKLGNGEPLNPSHFNPASPQDIFGEIARFAVEYKVDAVLAPTHFLGDPAFAGWFSIDCAGCVAMRKALDREGGPNIAIDYSLILSHVALNDDSIRSDFLAGLDGLPYENLWVRASGFGSNAGPLATRRFFVSMSALHNLGKPVVADYLGGLVGLAALAFGAVSGISHGIGERERFDARNWHKPLERTEDGGFGRQVRILVAGLDRSVTLPELELMANARGGRRLIACGNRECCPHGLSDMIAEPHQHTAFHNFSIISAMAAIPDLNREHHLLNGPMADAVRRALQVKDLKFSISEATARKIDTDALRRRLSDHHHRLLKLRSTLENLHETRAAAPRARAVGTRLKTNGQGKVQSK